MSRHSSNVRFICRQLHREIEVFAGLLEVVLPNPQPLAWQGLEVVEVADQPQLPQINTQPLISIRNRGGGSSS